MKKTSENPVESLILKTPIAPTDAIAQLSQALGLSDVAVKELFPNLATFKGRVVLEITEDEPIVISIRNDAKMNTYLQLWYGYDTQSGCAKDLISELPNHPRNRVRQVLHGGRRSIQSDDHRLAA